MTATRSLLTLVRCFGVLVCRSVRQRRPTRSGNPAVDGVLSHGPIGFTILSGPPSALIFIEPAVKVNAVVDTSATEFDVRHAKPQIQLQALRSETVCREYLIKFVHML